MLDMCTVLQAVLWWHLSNRWFEKNVSSSRSKQLYGACQIMCATPKIMHAHNCIILGSTETPHGISIASANWRDLA